MSLLLHLAAVLAIVMGLLHSVLGERYILIPLFRRTDLPRLFGSSARTTRTLRFAWHVITVALCGFAAMLVLLGQGKLDAHSVARVIGITLIAAGMLPLVITRGWHLSWLGLFLIGGIALACGLA
jgi:hypothetical protein